MPLNVGTLTQEVLKLTDMTRPDFAGFPLTASQVAANWAGAARNFFVEAVVPPALPSAHAAAEAAFVLAMTPLLEPFGQGSPTAVAALTAGFQQYALTLAAQATPPVALPPAAPLVIVLGPPTADAASAAAVLATTIYTWALTGLYGVPPVAPTIPWS